MRNTSRDTGERKVSPIMEGIGAELQDEQSWWIAGIEKEMKLDEFLQGVGIAIHPYNLQAFGGKELILSPTWTNIAKLHMQKPVP